MRYSDAKGHDYIGIRGEPGFCDECCFPASEHRIPECETIKEYITPDVLCVGRIVMRKKDRRYFFNVLEWQRGGFWHPLTVAYQSGFFPDAQDYYESWVRQQQVWYNRERTSKLFA